MRDDETTHGQKEFPYDDSLLINSRLKEVERQQREDKEAERKHNRSQLRTNRLIATFTGLLFVTSIVSDSILVRQTQINKESADAARDAANAASGQVKLMRQQLSTENAFVQVRADVMYATDDPKSPPKFNALHFTVSNVGQTEATAVEVAVSVSIRSVNSAQDQTELPPIHFPVARIGSVATEAPAIGTRAPPIIRDFPLAVPPNERSRLYSGQRSITVEGTISYNVAFAEPQQQRVIYPVCFVYWMFWHLKDENPRTLGGQTMTCSEFSTITLPRIPEMIRNSQSN